MQRWAHREEARTIRTLRCVTHSREGSVPITPLFRNRRQWPRASLGPRGKFCGSQSWRRARGCSLPVRATDRWAGAAAAAAGAG
eukprot:4706166-Prymnesium_polylepis.1